MIELVGALPERGRRRDPSRPATVWRGGSRSYGEFADRVERASGVLTALGLGRGDTVAVLSRNRPETLELMFAAARCGIVFLPVNFRLTAAEVRYVIDDARARVVFHSADFAATLAGLTDPARIDLEEGYEARLATIVAEPPQGPAPSADDPFAVFYTSGSTGMPKGVVLSHRAMLSGVVNHLLAYGLQDDDVCLHAMPLYHTMEASLALCQFYLGATNVIVESFEADAFWEQVDAHGVTHITLVHTMLRDLLDAHRRRGRPGRGTLRTISAGGQAVPVELIEQTISQLGSDVLMTVYGMTEAAPLLTAVTKHELADDRHPRRRQSIGRELSSCQVRVVNDQDRDVAAGELGEIIATGPNLMTEYLRRPAETRDALRAGWLRTGDLGTVDEDGFVYLLDRKKDLIISGGENIAPGEVEQVLYAHPAVREACVVGRPDARWGEVAVAVVALNVGCPRPAESDLIAHCRERLATFKCPRTVEFRDVLPRDPVGKLQRRLLREQVNQ